MGDYKTYLSSIYYNPESPAAFTSVDKVYRYARKDGKYVLSRDKIRNWLLQQESYAVHRGTRKTFKRRRVIAPYKYYQFDCDTADMSYYTSHNNGYKYFVLLIDIFTRYVWTVALKTKTGKEMVKALNSVFSKGDKPERLRTDKGTEYLNHHLQTYLREVGVKHFETQNEPKSSYAERAILSVKTRITKYMTHKQTHKWTDILEKVTQSYNHTYHRSIKQTPASYTEKDEAYQWKLQYETLTREPSRKKGRVFHPRYKFKVGQSVRISFLRKSFQKQHDERWSREIYRIAERSIKAGIPEYTLLDYGGEIIKGKFYQSQLLKASPQERYLVESILKRRKRGKKKEVLVKWKGWSSRYNSWLKESDLKDYAP